MSRKQKRRRTLEEILQSVSDVLFPDQLGKKQVKPDSRGSDGDTPLHVMIWRNDNDGARTLIESGADINAIGDMGETPLHVALRQNNLEIIALLLQAGAKEDIVSEFGETPCEMAALNPDVKKMFQKK